MKHLYEMASGKIAAALEAGSIPWRFPCLPRNALTGRPFGALNSILLNIAAARFKMTLPHWASLAQWQLQGVKVHQPQDVVDWGTRILMNKATGVPRLVREVVYNLEQTDQARRLPGVPKQCPDKAFEAIVKNAGIRIEYNAGTDCRWIGGKNERLKLPFRLFFEAGPGGVSGWYDALGHEILHWSESRMGWEAHYDVSELRAEIGTGLLGAVLQAQPLARHLAQHHDSYVGKWLKLIYADPGLLFTVCENVTATVAWLLRFAGREVAWLSGHF